MILSEKKSLKKASGNAWNPSGRQSLNGRIGWACGRALKHGLNGTTTLNLMSVCSNPRWISSDVSFSRFAGPGSWNKSSLMSPSSFNRSRTSILAQNTKGIITRSPKQQKTAFYWGFYWCFACGRVLWLGTTVPLLVSRLQGDVGTLARSLKARSSSEALGRLGYPGFHCTRYHLA